MKSLFGVFASTVALLASSSVATGIDPIQVTVMKGVRTGVFAVLVDPTLKPDCWGYPITTETHTIPVGVWPVRTTISPDPGDNPAICFYYVAPPSASWNLVGKISWTGDVAQVTIYPPPTSPWMIYVGGDTQISSNCPGPPSGISGLYCVCSPEESRELPCDLPSTP